MQEYKASQVMLVVKNLLSNARDIRDAEFDPWVGKIPLEEGMATHSSILTWRIPWTRGAWWATLHRVTQSRIQLK